MVHSTDPEQVLDRVCWPMGHRQIVQLDQVLQEQDTGFRGEINRQTSDQQIWNDLTLGRNSHSDACFGEAACGKDPK